mmetsp:Transcript_71759/g.199095  ORF Transcript_71759/g.199095 Transcript_71759/m.199095 type:complete len:293 (+) Transcript_71759:65-943(+)
MRISSNKAIYFLAITMRSKRCGLFTLARCCAFLSAHSSSSLCTRREAEAPPRSVGAPRSCFSRLMIFSTCSSVISEPEESPSCDSEKRLSKSASVRFLLAVDTFPLTLSTTIIFPGAVSRIILRTIRSGISGSLTSSSPDSPSGYSSQSSSLFFLDFFFFFPCLCFSCLSRSCFASAALLSLSFWIRAIAASAFFFSSSSTNSSPTGSAAFAPATRSAVSLEMLSFVCATRSAVSLEILSVHCFAVSGTVAGVGGTCGTLSSLGMTGPKRDIPICGRALFARFANSCSSNSS